MARLVKSSYEGSISVVIQTLLNDGGCKEKEYHIGDMIENLRYIENAEIHTITGRLSDITFRNMGIIRKYASAVTAKSNFASDVLALDIVVDNSEKYHSNVITIPCNEIIEDTGVVNVMRVKTYLKYGIKFHSYLTDGDENNFVINEGDTINGLLYMSPTGDKTISGRVVAFTYDGNLVPVTMVMVADNHIMEISMITVKDILGVSAPVAPLNLVTELKDSESGVVALTPGTITGEIVIPTDVKAETITICGAGAGIRALDRRNNCNGDYAEETIFAGKITVPEGKKVVLDGLVLTGAAMITTKNVPEVTLKNTIVEKMVPNGDNSFLVYTVKSDAPTKLNISKCYFGENLPDENGVLMKNGFELAAPVAAGSVISDNYFANGTQRNNTICLYNIEDGADIRIDNNYFERSANAIRVGCMGEPKNVRIDVYNNTYTETDSDPAYAGLLLIQPYGKTTVSLAGVTISMRSNNNETEHEQLFYVHCGAGDTQLTDETLPLVYVDGICVLGKVVE